MQLETTHEGSTSTSHLRIGTLIHELVAAEFALAVAVDKAADAEQVAILRQVEHVDAVARARRRLAEATAALKAEAAHG